MKKRTLLAGTAALAIAVGGIASGAAAADIPAVPDDAIVITEVTPLGARITGLVVKYDQVIDLGTAELDESAFQVDVALSGDGAEDLTGSRTVLDAYTTASPDFPGVQGPGEYVILTLAPSDALASFSYTLDGFTNFYDLISTHSVTQIADLVGDENVVPASAGTTVANTAVTNLILDDYSTAVFADDSGVSLPYRLFAPEAVSGTTYPLVITLHGAGERGTDNFSQVASNEISVAFANPARQASNPSFVLSPQAPRTVEDGWTNELVQDALINLVNETIASNPRIDPSRIYLAGLSMGTRGSWQILPNHTDLFAGAILTAGGGDPTVAAPALVDFPLWVAHSEDDPVNPHHTSFDIIKAIEDAGHPVVFSQWSGVAPKADQEAAARAAAAQAEEIGAAQIHTTYPVGTTPIFPHLSWVPTYSNDVILDWLFAQVRVSVIDDVPAPTLVASDQCGVEPVVELPADVVGISYEVARDGDQVIVVASALDGFVIAEGVVTEWTFDVAAQACPTDPVDPTPDPTDPTDPVDPTPDPEGPTDTQTPPTTDSGSGDDMPPTGVSGLPIFAGIALAAIGAGLWLRRRAVQ